MCEMRIVICTMILLNDSTVYMYSKQLFSRDNHSKREYPFISIYALLITQEFASFCTDFAPCVE